MNGGSELEAAIEAKLSPRREFARRLAEGTERWLAAERDVLVAGMIRQLKPGWTDPDADRARAAAVAELVAIVGELAPPAQPAQHAPKGPIVKRAATLDEQKNASRLLAEISRVDFLEPHEQLVPRVRMYAAEIRELLDPLSPADPTHNLLYDGLDRLRIVHRKSGMRQGVLGLDLAEVQPWHDLAQKSRRILDRVDRRAAPTLRASLSLVAGQRKR